MLLLLFPLGALAYAGGPAGGRVASHRARGVFALAAKGGGDDEPDLSVLSRRIAALDAEEDDAACLVLDAMVPRQRLALRFASDFAESLQTIRASGKPMCMLGIDPRQRTVMRRGVEARIESLAASDGGLDAVLIGGRRFELLETDSGAWPPAERLFDARVRWLQEPPSAGAAVERAESLEPLVARWIELVRSTGRERQPGQIDTLLGDLGPMPEASDADDRALWVAALINPLPALGVALEIRPLALAATSTLARLAVAQRGLEDSIARLEQPGPTF